jgi:hypothetical protein
MLNQYKSGEGSQRKRGGPAGGKGTYLAVEELLPASQQSKRYGAQSLTTQIQLYVSTPSPAHPEGRDDEHLFAGYFLPYPEQDWGREGEGFVSTISDDPPQLNWIYIDADTYEVKYGTRLVSEPHLVGPWDCTKIDKRITWEGWEGFTAVREGPGEWALYFDREDDGLRDKVVAEKRVIEIELTRKERKQSRPEPLYEKE